MRQNWSKHRGNQPERAAKFIRNFRLPAPMAGVVCCLLSVASACFSSAFKALLHAAPLGCQWGMLCVAMPHWSVHAVRRARCALAAAFSRTLCVGSCRAAPLSLASSPPAPARDWRVPAARGRASWQVPTPSCACQCGGLAWAAAPWLATVSEWGPWQRPRSLAARRVGRDACY
jgi:hypothetical protein